MNWLKDRQIEIANAYDRGGRQAVEDLDELDLQSVAATLGGKLQGKRVTAPGPHGATLELIFYSPERFFIYGCADHCGYDTATAYVCKKLNLPLPKKVKSVDALKIWEAAQPTTGTLVQAYLDSRFITLPVPDCIRFHSGCRHAEERMHLPAMVALIAAHDGAPKAVHITWLRRDGTGKSSVDPNRKTLGPIKGCTVQLAPVAEEMAFGEGIETCLSYMQMTGTPTWSAMNAVNLRAIQVPLMVRRVVLLADNKSPDDPGPETCRMTAQRLLLERRQVRIATAPAGMDFNDVRKKQCQ